MHFDEEAERSVLMSLLMCKSDSETRAMFDDIDVDLFGSEQYADTYSYLAACHKAGMQLQTAEVMRGLPITMSELTRNRNTGATFKNLLSRLKRDQYRRDMYAMAHRIIDVCNDTTTSVDEIESGLEKALEGKKTLNDDTIVHAKDLVSHALERMHEARDQDRVHVPFCIDSLDKCVKMYGGNLVVIAARPSVGKTALAATAINNQLYAGMKPAFICFEMDNDEIMWRIQSQRSGYTFEEIRDGLKVIDETKQKRFAEGCKQLSLSGFMADCGTFKTLPEVKRTCRRLALKGAEVIYIDYVQAIRKPKRMDYREHINECTVQLKTLAKELDIPIVILAQINREGQNQVPRISHLKESGAIEQDADTIILIDRPDIDKPAVTKRNYKELDCYGNVIEANMDGRAAVIIAKHRNGATGYALLDFDGPTTKFYKQFRPNPEEQI